MNVMPSGRGSDLPFTVEITIEAEEWTARTDDSLEGLAEAAVAAAVEIAELDAVAGSELGITFSDDTRVRGLNAAYRGKDKPTNVLSFPVDGGRDGPAGPLIGDIILGFETISRESEDLGIPFNDHLTHLIVHGLLHLFGYDHETEADAALMEPLETKILAALGMSDPYAPVSPPLEQ